MKLDAQNLVVVETYNDIKNAVQEFMPGKEPVNPPVVAEIEIEGRKSTLTAPTNCTYRDMLIEGFTIVKKRFEVIEKHADGPINISGHMWLDDLIHRRLGGVRDGVRVKWDLKDGTYFFDPFTGVVTKST